ncbi:hypothetical protein GOP47_0026455 [Adiantum capillus-veneris]|nr:hypothetical protein GOP47_0026455 [Adiantum capillus-veneris]
MASRSSLLKCAAAVCTRSAARRSAPVASNVGAFQKSSSALSSRVVRFRGAMVGLQSLHPLHTAVADSLFVSKLSFGAYEASFLRGRKPA